MASLSSTSSACRQCLARIALPRTRPSIRLFSASTSAQPALSSSKRISRSRRRLSTSAPRAQIAQLSRDSPAIQHRPEDIATDRSRELLQPGNLFHSFSDSPSPAIRKRAAFIKQNAYCPHPDHSATRQPTSPDDIEVRKTGTMPPAHVRYECPDCGIPVACCEEHLADDYEAHLAICDTLREINEDDHDLVSGRFFPEFEYPGPQIDEAQVNLTNWDTMLYSREFNAINDERSLRQATRLLTYPATV
ncbi:hypothetical protein KCU63_g19840, partial [Aureobasidium melanogenum]